MKILHVLPSTNAKGGGPIEGIKQLYKPLADLDVTVEITCRYAPCAQWHSAVGMLTIHSLGPSKITFVHTLHLVSWLRQNTSRFDAVIVNDLWQYLGLAVRQALVVVAKALACRKPVLISNKVNIWREIESDAACFVDSTVSSYGTVRNLWRWLALDLGSYVQMTERTRRCFVQRFHIQRAAERLVEIILAKSQ